MSETKPSAKQITQKRLMNVALYYLGRYESSSENLRRLLKRKILRAQMKGAAIPAEANVWIESVVKEVIRLGYVDDRRFALSVTEKYGKAGKSQNYIRQKLAQAGISAELQRDVLSETNVSAEGTELEAALLLVKKKKLGSFRPEKDRPLFRKKDMAVLARAGFSYQTAVKALGESASEEDENVWD